MRDAGGNLLSLYEQSPQTGGRVQRSEVPLYGASRLGVLTHLNDGTAAGTDDARYELNDHLGDARVVFHRPTTEVTTASCELTNAASQEDGQWPGLVQARRYSAIAHQGITAPSNYVAYAPPGGGTAAVLHRTVPVLKGDTLTFSAWTNLSPIGIIAGGSAARLHVVPLPVAEATSVSGPASDQNPNPTSRPGWLGRLRAGVALIGWGKKLPVAPNQNLVSQTNTRVWLRYRMYNEAGDLTNEQYQYQNDGTLNTWKPLQTGVRVEQAGSVEVAIGSDDNTVEARFDDLRLEQTGGMIVQEQHQYAYGSPLVGLNYAVGNKRYRYGYQGQYAEKDGETGFESFELRLYNSRIGRWTSDDPKGQFDSPYVSMSNNPVSGTDPDGGWSFGPSAIKGALIGAGVGAVAGGIEAWAVGHDWKEGALWGAGIGLIAGGYLGGMNAFGIGRAGAVSPLESIQSSLSTSSVSGNIPSSVSGYAPALAEVMVIGHRSVAGRVLDIGPVGNATLTSRFNVQRAALGSAPAGMHPGEDRSVPEGFPGQATADGNVVRSDFSRTFGNVIIIDHGPAFEPGTGRVYTLQGHGSGRLVRVGAIVTAGQNVLLSGHTGSVWGNPGNHSHYEVIRTTLPITSPNFYMNIQYRNIQIRFAPHQLRSLLYGPQ